VYNLTVSAGSACQLADFLRLILQFSRQTTPWMINGLIFVRFLVWILNAQLLSINMY
jgi:hypothetical protein